MASELTSDDIMKLGERLYLDRIQSQVEPDYVGDYIAIDVISGDYVVSARSVEAVQSIRSSHEDAVIALMRVGYETADAIGARVHRRGESRAA